MKRFVILFTVLIFQASASFGQGYLFFAAASSRQPLEAAKKAYEMQGGKAPRFVYAASSTLARQIEQGAKAEIFLSANEQWMDHLDKIEKTERKSRKDLCGNQLVLVGSTYVDFKGATWPNDIVKYLSGKKLALADPAHVPAGIYAKQSLISIGIWDQVGNQLAKGNTVTQALTWVQMGETPLGIVYSSDTYGVEKIKRLYSFSPKSHLAITYPLVLLQGASAEARAFYQFLLSPKGRSFFYEVGFTPVE